MLIASSPFAPLKAEERARLQVEQARIAEQEKQEEIAMEQMMKMQQDITKQGTDSAARLAANMVWRRNTTAATKPLSRSPTTDTESLHSCLFTYPFPLQLGPRGAAAP